MSLNIDQVGELAILNGPWESAYLEKFVQSGADQLIVSVAPDLEFLRDLPPLRRLDVMHLPLGDVTPIESQPTLASLSLNAYYKTRVDFSTFPDLASLHLDWGPGAESIENAIGLDYLSINRFPKADLGLLHRLKNVRRLRIGGGQRVVSLAGIEDLQLLEEARFLDLRNLTDLDPIGDIFRTLQSLEFDRCRRIGRLDALRSLSNLRKLHVLNCGQIESLTPLRGLPLESVLFYESTTIRDGDLSVLLDLPNLIDTAFMNRRHYSHTDAEIDAVMAKKALRGSA